MGHAINYDKSICLFICLFNFLLFQISFATLEEKYLYQYKYSSKIPHTEVFKDYFLMFKNSSSCFYIYNGKLIAEIVYT